MDLRRNYAVIVSTLALAVALTTGGAYAAGKIGPRGIADDAIRSQHVKNGSLLGADLRRGTVDGSRVRDRSLSGDDVRDGSLARRDLGGGVIPSGPAGWASVGFAPLVAPRIAGGRLLGVEVARPSRVLVVLSVDNGRLTCSSAGSCSASVSLGYRPRDEPSSELIAVPGAALVASEAASATGPLDGTVFGVVQLPAGEWDISSEVRATSNWSVISYPVDGVALVLGNRGGPVDGLDARSAPARVAGTTATVVNPR